MLRANAALAERIEGAECRLVVDMARAVQERAGADAVSIERVGSGAAICAGPNSPMSKWIGLGFDGALDEDRVAKLEAEFERRKTRPRVELSPFAHPSIEPLFARRGFKLIGHEDVLALELDETRVAQIRSEESAATEAIAVHKIEPAESRTWLDAVIEGFLHPDGSAAAPPTESFDREALERAFDDFIRVPGFDMYLARCGGVVAGGGGVRRFEGIAQLCGASTLPEHRRRGVQTALLRARLLDAARQGCELAVVTTEPGSKSQRNAEARGFVKLYARAILVRS